MVPCAASLDLPMAAKQKSPARSRRGLEPALDVGVVLADVFDFGWLHHQIGGPNASESAAVGAKAEARVRVMGRVAGVGVDDVGALQGES